MKILLRIMVICLLIVSCEETQPVIYDGAQTFVGFHSKVSNLEVTIDDTGSVDIQIDASTLSSQDRTFNVVLNDAKTTSDSQNFQLPSSVTIPANEYFGFLTVNGVDFNLETTIELIVISLEGTSGTTVVSKSEHEIRIKQVCPVSAPFLGNYQLTQLTDVNPDDGVDVFDPQVITLASEGGNARSFSAVYLEGAGIGQPPSKVIFNLSCNNVIVNPGIGTGLLCVQGEPQITLGPGTVPANYDPEDDSYFELTLTEYVTDGGCGASPYQVTFSLTKQ